MASFCQWSRCQESPVTTEPLRCSRIILTVQRANILLGLLVGNPMFEAITAFLVALSVGIVVAHTLDAFRS
jgi:ABC-type transport system involved in cytochrome c biogenesis permease component